MILSAEIVATSEAYLPCGLLKSAKKLGGVRQKKGEIFSQENDRHRNDRIALID